MFCPFKNLTHTIKNVSLLKKLSIPRRCLSTAGTETKAFAVLSASSKLEPYKVTRRSPDENDVRIKISYCGLNQSDFYWMTNSWNDSHYPMVPGHEIIGEVESIGSNVTKFKAGDKVGVGLCIDSCRKCPLCKAGQSSYCKEAVFVYNSPYKKDGDKITYGGLSSLITVDQNFVHSLPSNIDLATAAPLLASGANLLTPLSKLRVGKGSKIAINGLSNLGLFAVKLGVAVGAEVTAISHTAKEKKRATDAGAHHFMLSSVYNDLFKHSKNFDCLIDIVPVTHNMDQIFDLLKIGGTLIMAAAQEDPLYFRVHSLAFAQRKLRSSLISNFEDVQAAIKFCATHNLSFDCEHVKVSDINNYMERVQRNNHIVVDLTAVA